MRYKPYTVHLPPDELIRLTALVQKGSAPAKVIRRATILLHANKNRTDEDIVKSLPIVSLPTVKRVRKRYATEGLNGALYEKPRPGQKKKLTAAQETELVAIACSAPPKGRAAWTSTLLALELTKRNIVDSIHSETVRVYLKKTAQNRGSKKCGASER